MTDNIVKLEIARNVFRWLKDYGAELLAHGLGEIDPATEEFGPGIIDEISMDSPVYIYISQVVQYIRLVVAILDKE